MPAPTNKSNPIENMLEDFSGRTTAIKNEKCIKAPIGCGKPIDKFYDKLSAEEYRISGLCQNCQDEIFERDEEDGWNGLL